MNSHEFYKELKQLTKLGYLEQAQLDRIRDEYITNRKEDRSIFLIFALLGVVFMGAGLVSIFAYNWSMFSRELKALIAFLPLLGVQGALYWKIRTNASDLWIKSLTLALGLAFLSALGLVYQAYQISCSLTSIMLTGFLLMLPVIYLLDGYYLAVLYAAGICWAGAHSGYNLLILLLFPYYVKQVKKGETCRLLWLCFFIWPLYLAILYVPYGAYYACILILFIYMTIEKPPLYQKLAGRLLYIMLFLKAVFDLFFHGFTWSWMFGDGNLLLAALLAGSIIRVCFYYKKATKSGRLDLLLYGILCGLLMADHMISMDTIMWAYDVLTNLCLIAFSIYKLLCGIKAADPASVRRYTAAIILYIVLKVWLGHYRLLVKGAVFIIAGLAFFTANYRLALTCKERKEWNTHEDTWQ